MWQTDPTPARRPTEPADLLDELRKQVASGDDELGVGVGE
jgi:hypothetical protein